MISGGIEIQFNSINMRREIWWQILKDLATVNCVLKKSWCTLKKVKKIVLIFI